MEPFDVPELNRRFLDLVGFRWDGSASRFAKGRGTEKLTLTFEEARDRDFESLRRKLKELRRSMMRPLPA